MFLEISERWGRGIGEVDGDFFKFTVKNTAKHVQRVGAYAVIFAKAVELTSTEMVVFDELVL